jgi:tetratricopeptide (TPR) repeat protein
VQSPSSDIAIDPFEGWSDAPALRFFGETLFMSGSGGSLDQALANGAKLLPVDPAAAAEQAREIIRVNPNVVDAYRLLAESMRRLDEPEKADLAECAAIDSALGQAELLGAINCIGAGRLREAESLVRGYANRRPFDGAGTLLLAQIAVRSGMVAEAERLIGRTLERAPGHFGAKQTRAGILAQLYRIDEAIALLTQLHFEKPDDLEVLGQLTSLLGQCGHYDEAISLTTAAVGRFPGQTSLWLALGHLLKTVGRRDECVGVYREVIRLDPNNGEAWWSLANIKTLPFEPNDLEVIEAALTVPKLGDTDRAHLHFALGKGFDDQRRYDLAFAHFRDGNALRLKAEPHNPASIADEVNRSISLLSPGLLSEHFDSGCSDQSPIFILGMPRAGSTLIEQMLASHSLIEGTSELPVIPVVIQQAIAERWPDPDMRYPEFLRHQATGELTRLGEVYLNASRFHRQTEKPFFTDKLPNNWINIAFILLTLPNAKIIDARRHPLDCCLSNFQQLFARGQSFSYSLEHLGHYYSDYVRLMAHVDAVAPGRVHRVIHEHLVDDPDRQVRRIFDYLGLAFEPACLEFHSHSRAVRTASAEQVRKPLNTAGVGKWVAYDAWLTPLKETLGPVLGAYPDAPTRFLGNCPINTDNDPA